VDSVSTVLHFPSAHGAEKHKKWVWCFMSDEEMADESENYGESLQDKLTLVIHNPTAKSDAINRSTIIGKRERPAEAERAEHM
jgi:hypothetical protein